MTAKKSGAVVKVRDILSEWGMFFLNFFMTALIAVGVYATGKLDSIDTKVGSIDTTTQLNAQHINTLFDRSERHELADNAKFTDINSQIRKLQENRGTGP